MKNFEKDFEELIKIKEKIDLVNKDIENLNLQLEEECKNFIKKHTIQNQMNRIGNIERLLKKGISAKQLMDLIQRSKNGEIGLFALMNKLNDHMTGKKLDNDLLNYNLKVVAELESRINSLDSIENVESLNNLIVSKDIESFIEGEGEYLIDREVEEALRWANNPKFKRSNDKNQFVYMVVLNTIKKGDRWVLIYNYRAYNKIFLKLLYTYASLEQKFCLYNDKKGYIASDYFFIVDKQLRDNHPYISDIDASIKKHSRFLSSTEPINLLKNYWYNIIQVAKWCVNGDIKEMNFEDKEDLFLIRYLFMKDDINMLKTLNKDSPIEKLKEYLPSKKEEHIYNYLSRFIFIVSDLNNFENSLKNNIHMDVNQGPQKERGGGSYISYILSRIDKGFRDSMYNHNRIFLEYKCDERDKTLRKIPKSCFSYKNIHMNLGKIRWYSHSTKSSLLAHSQKYVKAFSPSYIAIQEIINSNLDSFNKQKNIEEKLREYWRMELYNIITEKGLDLNKFGIRVIAKQLKELDKDFEEYFNTKAFTKYKSYLNILKDIDRTLILSVIMSKCIPFTVKYENVDDQPVTSLFKVTGNALLWEAALHHYKNDIKNGKLIPKSDYKIRDYMIDNNFLLNEEESIGLGCDFISFFSERSNFFAVKDVSVKKNLRRRLILPKSDLKYLLENVTYLDTEELPMVINPLPWKINKSGEITEYGGTLTNHEYKLKSLMTASVKNYAAKFLTVNDALIHTVNKMASVKYIINKDVFDIISKKVYYKANGERLILFNIHEETDKLAKYNKDKNYVKHYEITSHNSRHLYEISVLNIASLMYNCEEIYFTNFIDWRGRIYTSSSTLNIQGGEIARALLLLKDGEVLNEDGVNSLKIYLANAYGLDKRSKFYRLNWVNTHLDEIIATPENDLWLKADEPLMFLACALELKGYLNNPKEFVSRLPILLDATCNGLQHLSGMTCDIHLAQRVNITKSSIYDNPRDIYSELLPAIEEKIKFLIQEDSSYSNLKYLKITRKLVKRGIMTITYGVTKKGILEQLLSEHFYLAGIVDKHYVYKAKDENIGDVGWTNRDLRALSEIIYNVLFDSHEVLKNFMIYFDNIVDMLNKLELPIQWITPSGLLLTQKYIKFTKYDITTAIRGIKPKKITLRKPARDDEKAKNVVINKEKQMNAFIPNFIHSFDAAHVVSILMKIEKSYKFNILTIHDCFGCQANYAELLAEIVKECFIALYIDKRTISNFHDHILNSIKLNYRIVDNKVISKEGEEISIPEKPAIGELEIQKILPYSCTFTS